MTQTWRLSIDKTGLGKKGIFFSPGQKGLTPLSLSLVVKGTFVLGHKKELIFCHFPYLDYILIMVSNSISPNTFDIYLCLKSTELSSSWYLLGAKLHYNLLLSSLNNSLIIVVLLSYPYIQNVVLQLFVKNLSLW